MFRRLAAVRVKTAEEALAQGRLEDAMEIAASPDLAGHRRVQQLLGELAERFLQRGQDSMLSRRFAEAVADFDKAQKCGGPTDVITQWRERGRMAMQDNRKTERDKTAALAVARERLAAGRLDEAAAALGSLSDKDAEVLAVTAMIEEQARRAADALRAAEAVLNAGRIEAVVEHLGSARRLHGKLDGLAQAESRVVEQMVKQIGEAFESGRLDRAAQQLAVLGDLGLGQSPRSDFEEAVRLARECARAVAEDHYARAGVLLGRLAQINSQAKWISEVRQHLAEVDEHRRALLAGPLGLLSGRDVPSAVSVAMDGGDETLPTPVRPASPPVARRPVPPVEDGRRPCSLPKRLLLQVDGGGSYVLLRGERIAIGRAGPGASADLQLISDLSDRQAEVIRAGEDYFVVSNSGVELGGRPVDHALLQDGDRLRLGRRIRLTFLRPSKKSETAVLELGDGVRTTSDCRRVILWGGPLLMGSTRECHVRLSPSLGGVILMERDGGLAAKQMGAAGQVIPLAIGTAMEIGELRFSVQACPDPSDAGKVIG
jgi:tetratricopeptide (TPR) repeat protein